MSEHQDTHDEIRDGYRRLSEAPTSGVDPMPEVGRRLRRRRTTRRAVAGVAALALVGGIGATAVLTRGGGGDDLAAVDEPSASASATPAPAPASTGPTSTLGFDHLDGTSATFAADGLTLACERAGKGKQKLTLTTTKPVFEPGADGAEDTLLEPLFYFEVVVDDASRGPQTFTLPYESADGSSDERSMTIFFATPEGKQRANEVSSAEGDAAGTVTVESASCAGQPQLTFDVDATLGSELRQPAMAIRGSYSS